MERLINYIINLNGTFYVNDLDITVVVPNNFTELELFNFGRYIEGFNNSDSNIFFPDDDISFDDSNIIIRGRVHRG